MNYGRWEDRMTVITKVSEKLGDDDMDKPDMVNSPSHYNKGGIECIDAIRAALGDEGFKAYCRGNALKYTWRAGLKLDEVEDLKKAAWYNRMAAGDDPRNKPSGITHCDSTCDNIMLTTKEFEELMKNQIHVDLSGKISGETSAKDDDILYVSNTKKVCRV